MLSSIYADLGFPDFAIKFADRPPVRAGADEVWDQAEAALRAATLAAGRDFTENPGEGAFYGPKLEFVLTDAIGRDWQCGTLQVDFVLPDRLAAEYVAADGGKRRAVMLHRAILGSFERFLGILIENHAGRMPLWLAPRQVVVATIVSNADSWAGEVVEACRRQGLRAHADLRNEKINYKVREHSGRMVPILLVVGRREVETQTVALRRLGGQSRETLPLAEAVAALAAEAAAPDLARAN